MNVYLFLYCSILEEYWYELVKTHRESDSTRKIDRQRQLFQDFKISPLKSDSLLILSKIIFQIQQDCLIIKFEYFICNITKLLYNKSSFSYELSRPILHALNSLISRTEMHNSTVLATYTDKKVTLACHCTSKMQFILLVFYN